MNRDRSVPFEEDEEEAGVAEVAAADVVVTLVEDGLEVVVDDPAIRKNRYHLNKQHFRIQSV